MIDFLLTKVIFKHLSIFITKTFYLQQCNTYLPNKTKVSTLKSKMNRKKIYKCVLNIYFHYMLLHLFLFFFFIYVTQVLLDLIVLMCSVKKFHMFVNMVLM